MTSVGVGLAFASSGGNKIMRAIRSLRLTEPDLPVHVVLDVSTQTWNFNQNPPLEWFEQQRNVRLRCIENKFYINGVLNNAMRWMKELGFKYGCLFHDDVVFSPLPEHRGHLSEWFEESRLQGSSALSLGYMQAFVREVWHRTPKEWDATDLESVDFWSRLLPGGKQPDIPTPEGKAVPELDFSDFFIQYHTVKQPTETTRLGPTGQIVPIEKWEVAGGFDETYGIFYDMEFPVECRLRKWEPVRVVPNVPHIHLHNQTIGFGDPARGDTKNALWGGTDLAFKSKYHKDFLTFWRDEHEN